MYFTVAEHDMFGLTGPAIAAFGLELSNIRVKSIVISEAMRLNESGDQVVGVYEADAQRVVIRRDQNAQLPDTSLSGIAITPQPRVPMFSTKR